MANHLHLIVRNRPDVAAKWSPEQIARKWLQLCPPYKPGTREVAETPSQADLDAILNNPARVETTASPAFKPLLADAVSDGVSRPGREPGRPDHRPVLGGAVQDAAAAR